MPTVSLTISPSMTGAAYSETLQPALSQGARFGTLVNGAWAPILNKAGNTGVKRLFIRHNGVNQITDVKLYAQAYGSLTGYTYGGGDTAANDFNNKIVALGAASGSSKNNADGLSGGLWVDMNHLLSDDYGSSQFDHAANGYDSVGGTNGGDDTVRIYGTNSTDGVSQAAAMTVKSKAMIAITNQSAGGNATLGWRPTAPVDGTIGASGSGTLGSEAHIKLRLYLPSGYSGNAGYVQFDHVVTYAFTS